MLKSHRKNKTGKGSRSYLNIRGLEVDEQVVAGGGHGRHAGWGGPIWWEAAAGGRLLHPVEQGRGHRGPGGTGDAIVDYVLSTTAAFKLS
jgi:hypothetical protein